MFVYPNGEIQGQTIETDVCIIGAGAAGITIARALHSRGIECCVLESGDLDPSPEVQALAKGENIGLRYHPLENTRVRCFGGSTNHWHGWCRPLKEHNFLAHPWIPHSGWPIGLADLQPFYEAANPLCEVGPNRYDSAFWESAAEQSLLSAGSKQFETSIIQFSPPSRFGTLYREELKQSSAIRVFLRTNAVEFAAEDTHSRITRVEAATLAGVRFAVRARRYVLAAGGLENPRILLNSASGRFPGFGNSSDLVGRFFMDHIKFGAGLVQTSASAHDLSLYQPRKLRGRNFKAVLTFRPEYLREQQLLDIHVELEPSQPLVKWLSGFESGKNSLVQFFSAMKDAEQPPGFGDDLARALSELEQPRNALQEKISQGEIDPQLPDGKFIAVVRIDPAPNPESRVTLGDQRDALGQRHLQLDWKLGMQEQRAFAAAQQALAEELGKKGIGRFRTAYYAAQNWPPVPGGLVQTGAHHMGTTKMHESPRSGVVDRNCRVHGTENLYVAGSSVFPTYAGYPTMTLIALALRLAQHLEGTLR